MTSISFTHSDFNASNARNSGAMKKLMGNEQVKKVLNNESRRANFYKTLQKYSKTGDTMNNAVRKTLGELRTNTSDNISTGAVAAIGRELIKNGSRYINPKNVSKSQTPSFKWNIRKGSDVMKDTYGKSVNTGSSHFTVGSNTKLRQASHLIARSGLRSG